jgi:ribosomal protein S5
MAKLAPNVTNPAPHPYEQKHGRRNRLEVFVIVGDHGTIAGPGNQCTVYAVDK